MEVDFESDKNPKTFENIQREFQPTNKINERWNKDDYATAILYACFYIEKILRSRIKARINDEDIEKHVVQLENKSFGAYMDYCFKLDLISQDKKETIERVRDFRNKIAHEKGFLMKTDVLRETDEQEDLREQMDETLEKAIKFIEKTPAWKK